METFISLISQIFLVSLPLNTTAMAGTALWSLALSLGFSPLSELLMEKLTGWLDWAQRPFYRSDEQFEETRTRRESGNIFWASIFSVVPFLMVGGLLNWGVELGLGSSWSISVGVIAAVTCGVYELGRRDSQQNR